MPIRSLTVSTTTLLFKTALICLLVALFGTQARAQVPSITSPANGTAYTIGQTVSVTATASLLNGLLGSINFYVDGTLVSTVNATLSGLSGSATTTIATTGYAYGTHTITASSNYSVAGVVKISASGSGINIVINPPVVAVTSGSYAFKQGLTLNFANTSISSTLTSFPALVYIKEDALKALNCATNVMYPTGGTDGTNYDFAFTLTGSSTELYYEVEKFDPVNGILLAWVQVPSVTNSNVGLDFYFGSSSPPHSAAFTAGTWATDYQAVYHFNEGLTTGSGKIDDATSFGRNETPSGTVVSNDFLRQRANTLLSGGAYNFNGSAYMVQSLGTNPTLLGPFTISAWVYCTSPAGDNKVITNELNFQPGIKLSVKTSSGQLETETRNTSAPPGIQGFLGDGGVVTASAWHYVQGVYTGSSFTNYLDGVAQSTVYSTPAGASTASNLPMAGSAFSIGIDHGDGTAQSNGQTYYNSSFFKGLMDEIRVSTNVKSADWIKCEHYNQTNIVAFTTAGTTISTNNAAMMVTIGGAYAYTWTGASSTDPTAAANWTSPASGGATTVNGAPALDGTSTLIIPAGFTNYPKLGADASIYGLTLNAGTKLDLNSKTLNVGCNIYNYTSGSTGGNLTSADISNTNPASAINWNGSLANQYYYGSASATATVGKMSVNNSSTGLITITGGPLSVYNLLTLTKGSLKVDNSGSGVLNLKSTAVQTASVAPITQGSVTGSVNVERYVNNGRNWRMMSSPIYNSSGSYNIVSNLISNFIVTGYGNPAGFDAPAGYTTKGYSILLWNGSLFTDVRSAAATEPVGTGFYFYYRGNRTTNYNAKLVTTAAGYPATAEASSGVWTGNLNQGNITLNATPTAAKTFILVGNPYAATLNVNAWTGGSKSLFANQSTNLVTNTDPNNSSVTDVTTWIWDPVNNCTNTTIAMGSGLIASGQGFFVRSSSAGSTNVVFSESMKDITVADQPISSSGSPRLLMAVRPMTGKDAYLRMRMVQDSTHSDLALVRFNDAYHSNYTEGEDIDDISGNGQTVFFGAVTADNNEVEVNSMPLAGQYTSFYLSTSASTSGLYTLKKTDMSGIPDYYDIWLMDHYRKDSLDLRANDTYSFNLDLTSAPTYSKRFEVVIRMKSLPPYQLIAFNGQQSAAGNQLSWKTLNEYTYTTFALQKSTDGGKTYQVVDTLQSDGSGSYHFMDTQTAAPGITQYRLAQSDVNNKITYSNIVVITSGSSLQQAQFSVYPNPASAYIRFTLVQPPARPSLRLNIYNSAGVRMRSATYTAASGQIDVSGLINGNYVLELIDLSDNHHLGSATFSKY